MVKLGRSPCRSRCLHNLQPRQSGMLPLANRFLVLGDVGLRRFTKSRRSLLRSRCRLTEYLKPVKKFKR